MKIYGHPLSSCTRKVLMTLAEKNESAEFQLVDLLTHAQHSAEHLARHPFAVVPVLDDDGFRLFESRAILRYLDARSGESSLTPKSKRDRARMDQWLSVDQSYVAPHLRTLAIERMLRKLDGLAPREELTKAAENSLESAFAILDDALASSEFLAGDSLSLADISLQPYVASLPMVQAPHVIESRPHLKAWHERMSARPSWKKTIALSM
jgi:glutathione S-transferase